MLHHSQGLSKPSSTGRSCIAKITMSIVNIKQACSMAVDACINDAFKVSNKPTIQNWQAGMTVMSILDQLLDNYGKPTPAMLQSNDNAF
jgi:hypothetical protein